MDVADLVARSRAGERRAIARLLSLIEGSVADVAEAGGDLRRAVALLHPHSGRAHRIGITGAPGVGKSTLTAALVAEHRRRGRTVAVVAVDPSSPYSGGALLGDRIRMSERELDEGVFIRSMASRGHLGGLSWATPHAVLVLDVAGFDTVVVETVGVGQAEVEIADVADTTLVVLSPGLGDAVQAAKAGILEVADIYVVNKADRPDADRTVRELQGMLEMSVPGAGWQRPVHRTVAADGTGVDALTDAVLEHLDWAETSGHRHHQRRRAAALQVREILFAEVRRRMHALEDGTALREAVRAVADRRQDPYAAADSLMPRLRL